MRDYGIDKGSVKQFNTSDRDKRGFSKGFWGFRKMFWTYLNKLNVPFSDPCCDVAPTNPEIVQAGFNTETGEFVFYDATSDSWLTQEGWEATTTTTTTTTTSTSTTTTTTTP